MVSSLFTVIRSDLKLRCASTGSQLILVLIEQACSPHLRSREAKIGIWTLGQSPLMRLRFDHEITFPERDIKGPRNALIKSRIGIGRPPSLWRGTLVPVKFILRAAFITTLMFATLGVSACV